MMSSTDGCWLQERMVLQNRVYCSELIAIFLQHPANQKRFGEVKGAMDVLLEVDTCRRRRTLFQ